MSFNYVIIPPANGDDNESNYSESSHTTPTRKRQRQDFNYIETGRFRLRPNLEYFIRFFETEC
jgi:hypothetical protein